jgi:hypothetical protein
LSSSENLNPWELGTAIVGSLIWMLFLTASDQIRHLDLPYIYKFVSGYVLGFLIAFSGFTFWEVAMGRTHQFLDDNPYFRWLSYIMLGIILTIGGASLLAEIFGNTNWVYNIGSLAGGSVVGLGVIPMIKKW